MMACTELWLTTVYALPRGSQHERSRDAQDDTNHVASFASLRNLGRGILCVFGKRLEGRRAELAYAVLRM